MKQGWGGGGYGKDLPHFSIWAMSSLLYWSSSRASNLLELRAVEDVCLPGVRGLDQEPGRMG